MNLYSTLIMIRSPRRRSPRSPSLRTLLCTVALPAAGSVGLLLTGCAPVTYVQSPPPPPPPQTQVVYEPPVPPPAAPAPASNPLDQLVAPIALYPDPLISIILPASTFPSDIQAAGAYLSQGGDPNQAGSQPWEPSVQALAHYPSVVEWMAQNLPWTQSMGGNFVAQPAQVMEAIQRLRELAQAAGTLTSGPQQQVIVNSSYVEIMPVEAGVIYVPRYDPTVVFVDNPYVGFGGPFFSYGPAYGVGVWLTFGCNWGGHGVVVVGPDYWHEGGGGSWGWRHDPAVNINVNVNINGGGVRPWQFPPNRPRPQAPSGWQQNARITAVHPITGAPARPPQSAFVNIHTRGPAAVTVVAHNPAAFKGKPLNPALLPRASGPVPMVRPAPAHGTTPGGARPTATPPRPTPRAEPQYRPEGAPTRVPQVTTREPTPRPTTREPTARPTQREPTPRPTVREPTPRPTVRELEKTPPPKVEEERSVPGTRTEPERLQEEKVPTKKPTPKPTPKPTRKPEEEKPKEDENPHN